MRTLIILLTSLGLAQADALCPSSPLIDITEIQQFTNDVGKAAITEKELKGCSWEKQLKYNESLKRIRNRLESLSSEILVYNSDKLPGRVKRQIKRAQKTVNCIKDEFIDDVSFRCHQLFSPSGKCSSHTMAYVDSVSTTLLGIQIKEEFPHKEINVCSEKLEDLDDTYRDATIMHELSHFCGVEHEDEKYFLSPQQYMEPKVKLDKNWHRNGDQFAYWYIHPFCVPGHDCNGHFSNEN